MHRASGLQSQTELCINLGSTESQLGALAAKLSFFYGHYSCDLQRTLHNGLIPIHKIWAPNSFSTFENPFENTFSSFLAENAVFSIPYLGLYLFVKVDLKY